MKRRRRHAIGLALVVLICGAVVALTGSIVEKLESPIDKERYDELMSEEVLDLQDLSELFREERMFYRMITPPLEDFELEQPYGPVLPFVWKSFPSVFLKTLVVEYENSVPVYPVVILEDSGTHETVFLNAKGEKIFSFPPEDQYDPYAYLFDLFPHLSETRYSSDYIPSLHRLYDPSRIRISVRLIPARYVEPYLYVASRIQEEQEELSSLESLHSFTLLRSPLAESNIVIEAMSRQTNTIKLVIGYPDSFTNRLDVFICNDLLSEAWSIAAHYLATVGTNEIAWFDTTIRNGLPTRLHAVANADLDTDGDGYSDMRECLVHKTDSGDSNSHPVSVSGTVAYGGAETGTLYILAARQESIWPLWNCVELSAPGAWTNREVGNFTSYWFKAFRDVDGSFGRDAWEPWGECFDNPVYVADDTSGIDIVLSDVPSIWGSIHYSGDATGNIHVVCVTESNSWSQACETVIPWEQGQVSETGGTRYVSFPAAFSIIGFPLSNYWIRAFIDEDADGAFTSHEAAGQYSSNALPIACRNTGIDITLEADSDEDGMPDWWEWQYGFDPDDPDDADSDADGDGWSNGFEYGAGTDPQNEDTDSDGLPDGIDADPIVFDTGSPVFWIESPTNGMFVL